MKRVQRNEGSFCSKKKGKRGSNLLFNENSHFRTVRTFGYQFSKSFWKGEIPADEDTHRAKRRLEHLMWGMG